MQDLTPVGLSQDGKRLLLVSSTGEEFAVPVDTRLRAALRGEQRTTRPVGDEDGKRTAPPRHPGAHPRGRVPGGRRRSGADHRRRDHGLRRPRSSPSAPTSPRARCGPRSADAPASPPRPARTLGEAAEIFFGDHSLHDEDVEWDAWRRPDGRWALVATYAVGGRARAAEFTHDLPGRYVVAENDEARILTGELREPDATGADRRPRHARHDG